MLTFNLNWKSVSAIAGLTLRNFYLQLPAGAIQSAQVIGFLRALHRQVPGKILPQGCLATQPHGEPGAQAHPPPPSAHRRLLSAYFMG